ncbi:hypothetical protein SAMN02787073_0784 [Chryseobacterium vrystaatense]|uniref:Uncharacterized protein n=2 Tax=Chryseobacterium vrystaatense TaxID=307480 RepID=A0A1M4V304_9FLAO|nr:hypothetical protein SAMN02787073_0784 [Chryseobacterium vrystaatense]
MLLPFSVSHERPKKMKYSYLSKTIFPFLLFSFAVLSAQKIIIINNAGESINVKSGKKEITINGNDKKEFSETKRISISGSKDLNRFINIFLEPSDQLVIAVQKNTTIHYSGDQASLHQYINEQLNIDTFGSINLYENAGNNKKAGELKNISELLLVNIMKKANLRNILITQNDKDSTKRLKNHIKYSWLNTLFPSIGRADMDFRKEVINYYFKKYIEPDIEKYSCGNSLQYNVLEILAKNKDILQAKLPVYPIVEHTDADNINQYLPQNCQKQYFRNKYNYLEHINGHSKAYYKKVLKEKFNDE